MKQKALLIVLDGYGEGKDYPGNAITQSNTPFIDDLRKNYPHTTLQCIGEHVGLPKNSMGGSEVGHFTMGAGRIVYQSLEEINRSIKKKTFFKKPDLLKAAKNCKENDSKFHILGMISDKGVHSHIDHLFALLEFAKQQKLKKVYIHAITDGRDVRERSADEFIKSIQKHIKKLKLGKIATIVGRYFAMDRDKNLSRTRKAYKLYTQGSGLKEKDALKAIAKEYKRGTETDYYINPIILEKDGIIEKKDSVVFFNYRTDRAAQLTEMFTKELKPHFVCFGPYSHTAPILFPTNTVKNNLSEVLASKGKKQLRIAETEKYAHVTFFFNSQIKKPYKGESRILIPSPKVPSYADKPEMSAPQITKTLIKELKSRKVYDFIALNFANCDLVGHSGNFEATVKAVETLDDCLSQIIPLALEKSYEILLTADHGNADMMTYPNKEDCPAHSLNPVPFIYISNNPKIKLRQGRTLGLRDIAPTILQTLGIKPPKAMTGKSLILKK
ncbi:2,3-bisphosphoglycerate-independent phosphoglycerate mutase [Patescibacteria group bacterium]|nr:2,3-bisphosphoglycerate-independent phosphoglycerate mutase [Patescibacteria group bacterium]